MVKFSSAVQNCKHVKSAAIATLVAEMTWIILFICFFHGALAGYKGTSITCECTTRHCLEHHMKHCNTSGVCFSQYLDRHDGSHPVVRGCIQSKTPLLCENRRPAVARGDWPLLLCCNSNLCNRDVVPTPPPWFEMHSKENSSILMAVANTSDENTTQKDEQVNNNNIETLVSSDQEPYNQEQPLVPKTKPRSSLPHIISPIYISVIVLGIISLIIIGIIATVVLRRSNRFYAEQYGALEQQHEHCCLKHANDHCASSLHCDCESQLESIDTCSQPYIHAVYQNQDSNNT